MKHKIFLLFAAALAVLTACQEQDWTYQGEQFFEYSPYENGQSFSGGLFSKENAVVGEDAIAFHGCRDRQIPHCRTGLLPAE